MKTIQIKFKSLLLLLMVGLAFTSCSNDEDELDLEPELLNPTVLLDCNSFQSSNTNAILLLENINDGVDYIIDCVVSVEVDLKIMPGVVVEFTDAAGMIVRTDGSINAIGSQIEPVILTGSTKTKGSWKGILSYSLSVKNQFDYVTIDYAGDAGLNGSGDEGSLIIFRDAYFRLNNVTITNGSSYGISSISTGYNLEINDCTITGCEIPIFTEANIVTHISGGDFTGNTTDVIRLSSGILDGTDHVWKDLGVPYRNANDLAIKGGATLTIDPGVIVEFEDTKEIVLDPMADSGSALIAIGTPTDPIVFTGVTKVPGSWKTISFRRSTSVQNKLDNVLIEYAGGAGAGGAIEMWVDPVLSVTNTTFKDIDACSLFFKYGVSNPNLTEGDNTEVNVSGDYMCND